MKGSLDYQLAWKILPRLEECKFHPPVIFTVGDFYEPANWLKQDSDVQEVNNRGRVLFVSFLPTWNFDKTAVGALRHGIDWQKKLCSSISSYFTWNFYYPASRQDKASARLAIDWQKKHCVSAVLLWRLATKHRLCCYQSQFCDKNAYLFQLQTHWLKEGVPNESVCPNSELCYCRSGISQGGI